MFVRPYIVLLFIITVSTLLFAIAVFFPQSGTLLLGSLRLKFITPEELLENKNSQYADISDIIKNDGFINDTIIESLAETDSIITSDTIRANADSLGNKVYRLQFSNNDHSILYPVFESFEKASKSSKPVRVMHYGDSQIEGDRITSYLRNRLQDKFGGMGVGLVPLEQVYDFKFSIIQQNFGQWFRYTIYGKSDTSLRHNNYGAMASFCRFSPRNIDTTNNGITPYEASVSFEPSPFSYKNTKSFQQCRIFYAHNSQPFTAELYQGNTLSDAQDYPASESINSIRWTFEAPVSRIKINFKGTHSPNLYGIALDGMNGIAVDNIAMRGNAGLIFTKMNAQFLKEHFQKLNVKLIILQYGGNAVPHIVDNYDYYERLFYAQLKRIRELLPDVGIIVIGVADMSIKENDKYVSYPNIEKVRDALKNAALKANAAYWDMFEAMGGRNSMPSWVFAEPPLAAPDFVHFNVRGAKIISQMFYNSLIYEYNLYKKNSEGKNEKSQ